MDKTLNNMDGWAKFRQTPQIKSCDMVLEMESEVKDLVVMSLEKYLPTKDYEAAASIIKSSLDKKFGGPWHVVIGEGFGFDIVHQARQMIHIHFQTVSCVVYKC